MLCLQYQLLRYAAVVLVTSVTHIWLCLARYYQNNLNTLFKNSFGRPGWKININCNTYIGYNYLLPYTVQISFSKIRDICSPVKVVRDLLNLSESNDTCRKYIIHNCCVSLFKGFWQNLRIKIHSNTNWYMVNFII